MPAIPPNKRRSSGLRRSKDDPDRYYLVNEALAFTLWAAALFFLYSMFAPALGYSQNLLGNFGIKAGKIFTYLFNYAGIIVAGITTYLGIVLWMREDGEPLFGWANKKLFTIGLTGVVIFSSALTTIVFGAHVGGVIGDFLAAPLTRWFGLVGSTCVLFGLWTASMSLFLDMRVAMLIGYTWYGFRRTVEFLVIDVPRFAILAVSWTYLALRKGTGAAWEWLHEEVETDLTDEELYGTPKKKAKRAAEAKEKDEEEADEPVRTGGEATHKVVVERRALEDAKISEKELKKVRKRILEGVDAHEAFAKYQPPELSLLERGTSLHTAEDDEELKEKSKLIENKLKDFAIMGRVTHIHPGPVITLFEFEPAPGVKVGKIAALSEDLAMSLKASSVRIIAPIPRRGTVGIEIPNKNRDIVRLRDVLESDAFINADSNLAIPLGKDTYGDPLVVDIAQMPHLLIAGATGTGKSVCINSVLVSLLYRSNPAELGLILIDPKVLELSAYDNIPHLRVPVVTVPRQAKAVLEWAVNEMNRRYRYMQKFGVRNIDSYNKFVSGEFDPKTLEARIKENAENITEEAPDANEFDSTPPPSADGVPIGGEGDDKEESIAPEMLKPLPKIVIVIDELADLMLSVGRDIEELITRLAQKARAAGIHLILATQRPSVDVITGLIKANFPARMSFRVTSRIDSRTILDSMGAEKLLGKGDMLFMAPGADALRRIHGAFVSDQEVKRVVDAVNAQCKPVYDERILHLCEKALEDENNGGDKPTLDGELEYDSMYDKCVELVTQRGQASTSMLQRAFRLGYNRAARIIDMMEREGIVGPMDGVKPREVRVPTQDGATGTDV